jgi:hypothetical protein
LTKRVLDYKRMLLRTLRPGLKFLAAHFGVTLYFPAMVVLAWL